MAAPLFLRAIPLLSLRLHHHHHRLAASILTPARRPWCIAAEPSRGDENLSSADNITAAWSARDSVSPKYHRWNDDEYRKWKDKEDEILRDIEPIASLTKEILHSERLVLVKAFSPPSITAFGCRENVGKESENDTAILYTLLDLIA